MLIEFFDEVFLLLQFALEVIDGGDALLGEFVDFIVLVVHVFGELVDSAGFEI